MKKNLSLLLLLFITLSAQGQTFQWEKVPGPYGGEVEYFGAANNYHFALLSNYVLYRSADGGLNWEEVPDTPFSNFSDKLIVGLDGKIYAQRSVQILVSEDNGDSWTELNQTPGTLITDLEVLPSGKLIVSNYDKIVASDDAGITWSVLASNSDWVIADIVYDSYNNRLYAFEFTNDVNKILLSSDEGLNWEVIFESSSDINDVAGAPDGGIWVAADERIYFSEDQGENWTGFADILTLSLEKVEEIEVLSDGKVWGQAKISPNVGGISYYTFNTSDNGQTWNGERIANRLFSIDQTSIWLARFNIGLYLFDQENNELKFRSSGMNFPEVYDIENIESGSVLALTQAGLFKSEDNLLTWDLIFEPQVSNTNYYDILPTSSGGIFILFSGKVFRTDSNLESFTDITPPPLLGEFGGTSIAAHPNGDIFLTGISTVYRSINNGETWDILLTTNINTNIYAHPDGNLYLTRSGGTYHSEDLGETWSIFQIGNLGGTGNYPIEIALDGTMFIGVSSGGIFWTPDEGDSWSNPLYTGNNSPIHKITSNASKHVFVSNSLDEEIRFSANQGISWEEISPLSLSGFNRYAMLHIPSDQHLYASTEKIGLYRTTAPTTEAKFIAGNLKWAENADCQPEAGSSNLTGWMIQMTAPFTQYSHTNFEGDFLIPILNPADYSFKPIPPGPYWEDCPQELIITLNDLLQDTLGPVQLAANSLIDCPFLKVQLGSNFLRRCFSNTYIISFQNNGTAPAENVNLSVELDPFMLFESASLPVLSQDGNTFNFSIGDLGIGEGGTMTVQFELSCDAEIGDQHCIIANLTPNDLCLPNISSETSREVCQINQGAFDPNDKRAFVDGRPEQSFLPPGSSLEYQIRFQNTGTDTAFNVVILDTLDAALEVSTFRPGVSSHPYNLNILGNNILEFTFENIMLPDSNVNEAASHGFVNFEISTIEGLEIGTAINNDAAIYFDFNEPIITNQVELIFDEISRLPSDPGQQDQLVKVYPNPFSMKTTFEVDAQPLSSFKIQLFDAKGLKVLEKHFSNKRYELSLSSFPAGVYWYKVITDQHILGRGKLVYVKQ